MLHVELDLSRTRVDVHVMNEAGAPMLVTTAAPDAGGLASLAARVGAFERPVTAAEAALRRLGAEHPYVPLLVTVPGIGPVLGYTIAAEIGEITRFSTPKRLVGDTGLCPTVDPSGRRDHRDWLAKNGPKYLRWALIEAAIHAAGHPVYAEGYQRTRTGLGKQRGARIARVDLARELAEAIWWMLITNKPFAPAGAAQPLAA